MSLLIPPFGREGVKERDWLGRARTGGGNLVKAAHKGIHKEKERERRDDGRMPPSMPLLNTQVGKGVPSPDEFKALI